ncbi:MAG: hypothetical protein QW350_03915 [Candidatus Aenigmatarchaeota archaeon]
MGKSIVRNIWSMIIMNIVILVATLTLHELGHALAGKALGCVTAKAIIYDSQTTNPYTELVCNRSDQKATYVSGLILTTFFGISFLAFENKSQKTLSLVIIGFGIFLSALDIVEITGLSIMQYIFISLGLLSLVIGQILYGIFSVKE